MTQHIRFEAGGSGFQREVKERVDAYFAQSGLSRHADLYTVSKMLFWVAIVIALYAGLITGALPGIFALALGFSIAEVGFNVGHDALHRATSSHGWVNVVLGWSFDMFGGSSYAWNRAHNVVHHTYTNMPGIDTDIDSEPWMHFHPQQKVGRYYRWQHVFAFAFYTLTMLAWTFVKDFKQLSQPDPRTQKRTQPREWAGMLLGKLVHFSLFVIAPLMLYAGPWWHVLVGYVLMQMAVGFTLAVVFQLAHVVEGTEFPRANADGVIARSWAEHQLHTTANFSSGGALATFFTGGLNHQIEHHLFPRVSHTHYAALSKIVRKTAAEFGLPYHESRTFLAALASHMRTMRRFGLDAVTA